MSNDYDWRTNLFVYGTLKKGGRLHSVLGNSAEYVGQFVTANSKYDLFSYARSFPIMVARENGYKVRGEVWSVTPESMDRVNAIESGSHYYPFQIDVMNEHTKEYEIGSAMTFLFPGNKHKLMPVSDINEVDGVKEWIC